MMQCVGEGHTIVALANLKPQTDKGTVCPLNLPFESNHRYIKY